jgi:hypothetical protein
MRQEKMKNFLEANTILAAAIGLSISNFFSNAGNMSLYLILAFSTVGLVISVTWTLIMVRNSDYMRFQRLNLCSIEKNLPEGFNTFSNMNLGFDKQAKVNFYCGQELIEFKPSRMSISANKIENFLPAIIAVIWSVVIVVSTLSLANIITLS